MENFNKNDELKERIAKYPDRLKHPIKIINKCHIVYEGSIILRHSNNEIVIDGTVEYRLVRYPRVFVSGQILTLSNESDIIKMETCQYEIIIEDKFCGNLMVTDISINSDPKTSVVRGISEDFKWKIDEYDAEYIIFALPNIRDFSGGALLKDIQESKITTAMDRFIISESKPFLCFDRVRDFKLRFSELKSDATYEILYVGKLHICESMSVEKFNYIFPVFLSFINGRKSASILSVGMVGERTIWIDFSKNIIEPYQYSNCWSEVHFPVFVDIWKKFNELWEDELDRDFLITAIHWYVEANSNAGKLEGAIILMQTALELVFNWLIVEKLNLVSKINVRKLSAEGKILHILKILKASEEVPKAFFNLTTFVGHANGPRAITEIRNALVHGNVHKREKMLKATRAVTFEALHLGIWYIELSLLYILDYKGHYKNRTNPNNWTGKGILVPWELDDE
jgi:hypothetical protein